MLTDVLLIWEYNRSLAVRYWTVDYEVDRRLSVVNSRKQHHTGSLFRSFHHPLHRYFLALSPLETLSPPLDTDTLRSVKCETINTSQNLGSLTSRKRKTGEFQLGCVWRWMWEPLDGRGRSTHWNLRPSSMAWLSCRISRDLGGEDEQVSAALTPVPSSSHLNTFHSPFHIPAPIPIHPTWQNNLMISRLTTLSTVS